MLVNPPTTIGWRGAGRFASTLLLTGVLALVARYRPPCRVREHGAGLALLLVRAALTAGYWWRVWSYSDWEVAGVAIGAVYIIGCWWPAVMIVDRHVSELPPAAPHGIATIAPEAMTWAHDARQLLDVEMHELAWL
jgi:hypothetical protein